MNPKLKKLLIVMLNFTVLEFIYQLALYIENSKYTITLSFCGAMTAVGILFAVYIVMTKGYPEKPHTPDMLKCTIPYEERVKMCEVINAQKEKAKKLLYFIIPLLFIIMIDALMVFVFPQFFNI